MTIAKQIPLLIISGPTAMGKTQLSLHLTTWLREREIKAEIVNFDSLLFYRELHIGTAKPNSTELADVKHHLINISSAKEPLNASHFVEKAVPLIEDLRRREIVPILVGGSAFYLRALMKDMYQSPGPTENIKKETEKLIQTHGIEGIREFLRQKDPKSYEEIHANDQYRLTRAYEHFRMTGTPLSREKERIEENRPYDLAYQTRNQWRFSHIYLDLPKNTHYPIIEQRAREMVEAGLIEEVQELLQSGEFRGDEKPLQSIGYKEVLQYLKGNIEEREELIQQIFIATRQLAKAQRTFFQKITPKQTFHPLSNKDKIFQEIQAFLQTTGLL